MPYETSIPHTYLKTSGEPTYNNGFVSWPLHETWDTWYEHDIWDTDYESHDVYKGMHVTDQTWDDYIVKNHLYKTCSLIEDHPDLIANKFCLRFSLITEDNPGLNGNFHYLTCSLLDSPLYSKMLGGSIRLAHKRVLDGTRNEKRLRSLEDCNCPYCSGLNFDNYYEYNDEDFVRIDYTGYILKQDFSNHPPTPRKT